MNTTQLAPVILFVYKRLDTLRSTLEALASNDLASESDLIIFSDGARNASDEQQVAGVRAYLKNIEGFKSVVIHESPVNKGLAQSIIGGVSQVLKEYPSVIVLEDDMVSSPNFLTFMNAALRFYENNHQVFSISGFTIPIVSAEGKDVYFTQRANSSTWASWSNRWEKIDWNVPGYETFKQDKARRKQFNRMGSDMSGMLDRQMSGKLNSWAIRWCFHQFEHRLFSVYPVVSKTVNIGLSGEGASNTTARFSRFGTTIDQELKTQFHFPETVEMDPVTLKQFLKPHSLFQRAKYKLMNLFPI